VVFAEPEPAMRRKLGRRVKRLGRQARIVDAPAERLPLADSSVDTVVSTLVLGTALAGVGLVLQLLQSTLSMILQAQLRFGWVSAGELLRQVVNVGLLVALALAGARLLPLLAVAIPASAVSLAFTVPLVLRYAEGLTYAEISEILSISIPALKSRLFRARNMLAEKLEEKGETG